MSYLLKSLLFTAALLAAFPVWAAYEKDYIGEVQHYSAAYEDTFVHLARDYNLGYVEMRAANPDYDPWIPGEGAKLVFPTRHLLPDAPREGIVINLADMRLYAYVNGDEAPASYPLGIGREGLGTPLGETRVVRKTVGPIWTPTPRMRREDPTLPERVESMDPENPMGTHALYLGFPQIAIHGTDKPFGIGRRVSSGCLRLYPEDIVTLYDKIPVGTRVTVVDQPIKLGWIGDELYMEAHPALSQAIQMEENGQISVQKMSDEDMKRILKYAGEYQDRLHWATIRNAIRERKGYPVMIARKPSSPGRTRGSGAEAAAEPEEAAPYEPSEEEVKEAAAKVLDGIYEEEDRKKSQPRKRTLNP